MLGFPKEIGGGKQGKIKREMRTKETRMGCHVCTFQHLCDAAERRNEALDDLKGRMRALVEGLSPAVGIVGVRRCHHAGLAQTPIQPSTHPSAVHGPVPAVHGPVPAIHGPAHRTEPIIR